VVAGEPGKNAVGHPRQNFRRDWEVVYHQVLVQIRRLLPGGIVVRHRCQQPNSRLDLLHQPKGLPVPEARPRRPVHPSGVGSRHSKQELPDPGRTDHRDMAQPPCPQDRARWPQSDDQRDKAVRLLQPQDPPPYRRLRQPRLHHPNPALPRPTGQHRPAGRHLQLQPAQSLEAGNRLHRRLELRDIGRGSADLKENPEGSSSSIALAATQDLHADYAKVLKKNPEWGSSLVAQGETLGLWTQYAKVLKQNPEGNSSPIALAATQDLHAGCAKALKKNPERGSGS